MISMKKIFFILTVITMVFSLAACSGSGSGSDISSSESSSAHSETAASQEGVEADDSSSQPEASGNEDGILVAYFSWSGNTRQMAEIIARETGADLFEIAAAEPYTDDYNTLLDVARQEQEDEARPELDARVENWDSYDTIFVGYPNWWSDAPMAVYTFLESYDFTGKTLIPFNTSASGGFGRSLAGIEESADGAEMLEGLDLTEGELDDAQNRVTGWLESLGLNG